MKVVYYNLDIYEDESGKIKEKDKKIAQFIGDIREEKPEVVLVGGLVRGAYDSIFKGVTEFGMKRYIPDRFKNSVFNDTILTSLNVVQTEFVPFYFSGEGAGVTMALLEGEEDIWVATCRFELAAERSFNKLKQLKTIFQIFKDKEKVILGVDTNFSSYMKEPELESGWFDGWVESGDRNSKITYDCDRNPSAFSPCKDRRDRILYKGFESSDFHLVGTNHLYPTSPHFGVACTLE